MRRRGFLAAAPPLLLLAGGCAAPVAGQARHEVRLVTKEAKAALRGGAHASTPVWTYGGLVPGPEIRAVQGARLHIEVTNALADSTTVHWHGVRAPNAMDGVPHMTQAPIEQGERFVYEFDLLDAGTYWYHSHHRSSEQVERGLYGALVVEERKPLRMDRDLTWVLDDWRLARDGALEGTFGHPMDVSHAGRIGNLVTLNGQLPTDLRVRRGERLRLRLINAANARIFGLTFDGHNPQIVAIDGQPVVPHGPAEGVAVLAPGMRMDLVLDAVGEPGSRHAVGDVFYPRAAYDLLRIVYGDRPLREHALDAPIRLPANPLKEPDLEQAHKHEFRFEGGAMGRLHGATLDGRPLAMMDLMRQGKAWAVNGVVAGGHAVAPVVTLRRDATYLLSFVNDTRWHHPIHLHGHSFRVLSRNGKATAHREWQDTVLMAPEERVDVALVADNPGDWMLHCHILEHQDGGMMTTVRVG